MFLHDDFYCLLKIRKMDLEARSLQPTQKAILLAKLREYKADLNNLKRELKKASSETEMAREELLEGGHLDPLRVWFYFYPLNCI
jgi:vesicle transport through interaction with t-SNAREs protein 1